MPISQKPNQLTVEKANQATVEPKNSNLEQDNIETIPSEPKRWREMNREEKRDLLKATVEREEQRFQSRRAARGLPPLTDKQLRRRRAAARNAVRDGRISRPQARRAVRRAVVREQILQRKGTQSVPANPESGELRQNVQSNNDPIVGDVIQESTDQPKSGEQSEEPAGLTNVETNVDAEAAAPTQSNVDIPAISPELKQKIQENGPDALKMRLRNATPAERRRILRGLRKRNKSSDNLRDARKRLRDLRNARR